jgi:hypothetical protein
MRGSTGSSPRPERRRKAVESEQWQPSDFLADHHDGGRGGVAVVATLALTIGGQAIAGRWVIIDRQFRPAG